MKKGLLVVAASLLLPLSSFAWIPSMQFQVTHFNAAVQVINPTPYNAYCQGYVYGQTQMGPVVNSWFASYVPAGGYAYAYVYTGYPYYFVNAWAQINCQ